MQRGATLVAVDRTPDEGAAAANTTGHHEISASRVEQALIGHGFQIVFKDDHFIDRAAEGDHWWLIEFCKP